MAVDIGKLTHDETKELFIETGRMLTEEALFEALNAILTEDQKDELGESWFKL